MRTTRVLILADAVGRAANTDGRSTAGSTTRVPESRRPSLGLASRRNGCRLFAQCGLFEAAALRGAPSATATPLRDLLGAAFRDAHRA
jgi:hypothetical protein